MTRSTIERLGDAFHAVVFEAWQANGPAIIESVRREHPAAYLKLIASVLPRQSAIPAEPFDVCTDHDLEVLRAFLAKAQESQGYVD